MVAEDLTVAFREVLGGLPGLVWFFFLSQLFKNLEISDQKKIIIICLTLLARQSDTWISSRAATSNILPQWEMGETNTNPENTEPQTLVPSVLLQLSPNQPFRMRCSMLHHCPHCYPTCHSVYH
jgi:hypothetical protein